MRRMKKTAFALSLVAAVVGVGAGLMGCAGTPSMSAVKFHTLLDEMELFVMGDDAVTWNVVSVDPSGTFGYVRESMPEWYSYSQIRRSDIADVADAFEMLYDELGTINVSRLSDVDAAKYRSLEFMLSTYVKYYGSPYAYEFSLFGGSYISDEGGYVADFASSFENYAFRNEDDVNDLLTITKSTRSAFATYDDFAKVRIEEGYPLYDYTICAMQDYLNGIVEAGDDYYLYEFANKKIDGADFLTATKKAEYKQYYSAALTDYFMEGVGRLSQDLEAYKGASDAVCKSYLGSYGEAGRAYYEWLFYNRTGMKKKTVRAAQNELADAFSEYTLKLEAVEARIDALKTTDPETYAAVQAYIDGGKAILDLDTPEEMMTYLQSAAKSVVPDLQSMPEITFKIMDETVADFSSALAYYLQSPVDNPEAVESVTVNPNALASSFGELLFVIAHEGYPGHLYASVAAKEAGFRIMGRLSICQSFSEGWANYAAATIFDNIAKTTDDPALAIYCEYLRLDKAVNYIYSTLLDMSVNYFGMTANDFVGDPEDYETQEEYDAAYAEVVELVGALSGMPCAYVPYGYGMYIMLELHDIARDELGGKYSEVEFNKLLLAEGMGPTLDRAIDITSEYVK